MQPDPDPLPALSDAVVPPLIRGTADLATFAYQGHDAAALFERIGPAPAFPAGGPMAEDPGWLFDRGLACQLAFGRAEGLGLQDAALARSPLFRVRSPCAGPAELRVLALCAPGDLMVNTPLDFLTGALDVRLDLLFLQPGRALPPVIPDHDLAFFAANETEPAALARLRRLFRLWPRPALNDPTFLPRLDRAALSAALAGIPGICSPSAVAVSRAELDIHLLTGRPLRGLGTEAADGYPLLIRPFGSHAGTGLARADDPAALRDYLRHSIESRFHVTRFEEYAGPDGLYRKRRIAFIDREPFLCHMAISSHWMVHYLNAGMTTSAEKRAMEDRAMAGFEGGFARRHEAAFAALHRHLGFDLYAIDCAETRDGRLLVFEADTAAIIHAMDPPDLFPYKVPQMQKVFAAFGALLRRRAAGADRGSEPAGELADGQSGANGREPSGVSQSKTFSVIEISV